MHPEVAAEPAAAAMNFLANTDALIIDLRQNGGGGPQSVVLLCSYLFDKKPVHLNDLYWRKGNRTEEFWTLKEVAGKRYLGRDVYLLTSRRTFSAAEEFAYDLQNLKRVTIVGERTGGGAHPGGGVPVAEHFVVFIPSGRAINPITKTNWEGIGVKPDVEVAADKALETAHQLAIKKLLEKAPTEEARRLIQMDLEMAKRRSGAVTTPPSGQPAPPVPRDKKPPVKVKWQYKALTDPDIEKLAPRGSQDALLDGLNKLGDQGWELVTVIPGGRGGAMRINIGGPGRLPGKGGPGLMAAHLTYLFKRLKG
jgi:hypothetical protein